MSEKASRSSAWKWVGRAAIAAVLLALVLAALVAFVVPGIAITQAAKGMQAATGRKLAIGALSIHPFTWQVEVKDLSLSEQGGKGTFASFKRAQASVSPASLLRGAPVISQVRLEGPHFNVIRTGPNTFNFSDLMKYLVMPVPALSLEDVAITGGSIDFTDLALAKEERHTVRDAELKVPFLTTVPARAAEYGNPRFSAVIDGAPLVIETKVRGLPKAPEVSAQVDLKDLSLPVYLAYLPAELPVKVDSGKVAIQGTASYRITAEAGGEIGWDGTIAVTEIKVSEQKGPIRVDVAAVSVRSRVTAGAKSGLLLEDGALEVKRFTVPFGRSDGMTLGLLSVTGARFSAKENRLQVDDVLLSDGSVRISRDRKGVFSPMPLLEHLQAMLPRGKKAPGQPIRYRVKKVEGKGIDAAFTDGTRKELPSFALSQATFQAEDVEGPLAGPIAFSFSARLGKDATIKARGKVVPTPLAADIDLELKGLPLADGSPYVPEGVDVAVADGRLDLALALAVATRKDRLVGTYGGSAAIRSLKLLHRTKGKLVAWERLSIDGVKGALEPMTLSVARIGLSGLRADLTMREDGKLDVPEMPRPSPEGAPKEAPAKGKRDEGFQSIRVDQFAIDDGRVDFTDRGVPGEFHATIQDISVRVTGMSSEPGKFAEVRAQMTLPKGAPLRVSGKAAPLKKPAYADLDLVLEGLDLSTASPYAGVHLGLEIDRGALTVKSRARVEQGKLAAENRIRVDQLTYGKAVKSDKATILPVRLLTDILRNKDGDIVLDLPVSARTDDEDVAGTITGQVVKEVIFPPGSPLRDIPFAACSAELESDGQGRLRKLAGALQERPAMKITAVGYVDRETDGKACRERAAAEKAAAEKLPATKGAADKIVAPSLEGDARMRQLAEGRATAVRDFLVLQGAVEASRVSAATGDVYAAPRKKGEKQARVEFARATD
jgi:hypothetical protein